MGVCLPSRTRTTTHSASAPDTIRMSVKLAASMAVCFSAMRQSKEFAAKASIANSVKVNTRARGIARF